MPINTNVNPAKSFNFVRFVTSEVARETNIRYRMKNGAPVKTAYDTNITSQDIANNSRKGSIRIQGNITPQDRLIDLVI